MHLPPSPSSVNHRPLSALLLHRHGLMNSSTFLATIACDLTLPFDIFFIMHTLESSWHLPPSPSSISRHPLLAPLLHIHGLMNSLPFLATITYGLASPFGIFFHHAYFRFLPPPFTLRSLHAIIFFVIQKMGTYFITCWWIYYLPWTPSPIFYFF